MHSQFYRCSDRADAPPRALFVLFRLPFLPFFLSSFFSSFRVPFFLSSLIVTTLAARSWSCRSPFAARLLVVRRSVRRLDSTRQPRLSVGVEGKCQGEGVDWPRSKSIRDRNREFRSSFDRTSLFLLPVLRDRVGS